MICNTEKEKQAAGLPHSATDPQLVNEMKACWEKCHAYNQLNPSDESERHTRLLAILGKLGKDVVIQQPFRCDYGYKTEIGDYSFLNFNCTLLDAGTVIIGKHVFIGPNCGFYTVNHAFDVQQRNEGIETAAPIVIEDQVWIGAQACVMPGVTIGRNSIIGAGSVVTKSIPPNVIAAGNPCRVLRENLPVASNSDR